MAIPPGSLQTSFDFQNPACFTDGGTAITDLSGNSNNWTINNTTYTYDNTVGSILFPTSCYADGTPSTYAFGTAAYSVLAWVKFNTSVPGTNISDLGGGGTGDATYFMWRSSDDFIVSGSYGAAGGWIQAADNEWHLLALTRPSSGTVGDQQAYIDGVLITNNPANFYNPSAILNQTSGLARIHSDRFGAPGDLEIGTFDVYTTQLGAGDILDIYNNTKDRFLPPDLDLDFINPACFTNGTTALNDLSGNGKDFTLDNTSYTYDPTVGSLLLPTGLQATGDNTQFAYGTQAFTVLSWVKLNIFAGNSNIFLIGPDGGGTRIFYNITASSSGNFNSDNGGSGNNFSPFAFDDDWHLLALTRPVNGLVEDQRFYVDGVEIPTSGLFNGSTPLNQGSGGYCILHSNFAGESLTFATLKIYLAEFDSTQITNIYNAEVSRFGPPPPPPPYEGKVGGRQFAQGFNG